MIEHKDTLISDWLLTDFHTKLNPIQLSEKEKNLNTGKEEINIFYKVNFSNGDSWSEVVGEILSANIKDNCLYIKILFYQERIAQYGIQLSKIPNIISLPLNLAEYCS